MTDRAGLRIVFAGTPEFAAIHLKSLLEASQHQVVAVYTQPDRPAGRGKKLQASPVKELASAKNIPVFQPQSLKGLEEQAILAEHQADLMIVVAYGLLLPKAVLDIPRLGCVNVHASLLPRWRGAAPIQRAIEAGDKETGITIMQMDVGLDTGDMLNIVRCPITHEDTAGTLHDRLASIGPAALAETLQQLVAGTVTPVVQDHDQANYAHKLTKEEALIHWAHSAEQINLGIRAFNPFPVAFTLLNGERMRVFSAIPRTEQHGKPPGTVLSNSKGVITVACGNDSVLDLTQVQLPGKKVMAVSELLNGSSHLFSTGITLG